MRWIDLSDRERFFRYVATAPYGVGTMFQAPMEHDASYFVDATERSGAAIKEITTYYPESIASFRENLDALWMGTDLPDQELLVKITIAAALKSNPIQSLTKIEISTSNESANDENIATATTTKKPDNTISELGSVFVYEF